MRLSCPPSFPWRYESVGRTQGEGCPWCPAGNRLADQAAGRLAQDARARRLADYVFAFHDGVEIGPHMLSRITRHTGLKPEDL